MNETIREKLLSIYKDWEKNILDDFFKLNSETNYSKPFVNTQVFEENGKKNIMVIGQEARSFFKSDDDKDIEYISKYVNDFFYNQIHNAENMKPLKTPFWKLVRSLSENHNVLWNNLDKLHKYKDQKTHPLTAIEELLLHKPFDKSNKSLLRLEIELLEPDAIIFAVGPHYYKSLFKSLGIESKDFKKFKPTKDKPIHCFKVDNLKAKIFWSYHPRYLTILKELDFLIKKIENSVKNKVL